MSIREKLWVVNDDREMVLAENTTLM